MYWSTVFHSGLLQPMCLWTYSKKNNKLGVGGQWGISVDLGLVSQISHWENVFFCLFGVFCKIQKGILWMTDIWTFTIISVQLAASQSAPGYTTMTCPHARVEYSWRKQTTSFSKLSAGCNITLAYPSNQFRRRAHSGKASVPPGDLWGACVRVFVSVCVSVGLLG